MKSLIIKNTIAVLVMLFSLQLHAQILDSLVKLPWDVVKLSSCDDNMGEGPTFNGAPVIIQLVGDDVEEDEFGNCILRTRTWNIFSAGVTYSFTQQGIIDLPEPLMCKENVYLKYDQLPFTLSKDNLLLNEEAGHQYSFKYYDIDDVERTIKLNGSPYFEMYMYDHTSNKVCKSNIFKTNCEEDMVINIPEFTEFVFNGEPYVEITPDMLGVEVDLPCDNYTVKLNGSTSSTFLSSQRIGSVVEMKVDLEVDNILKKRSYINVKVSGIKPDPISMFIEDVSFVAGETIELDIWSQDIIGLGAWGLQLNFENAEILSMENPGMFNNIPINLYPDGKTIRALWYSSTGYPIDIESDGTWFTLVIKPEIDGGTLDIFKSQTDPWSHIAIETEDYLHEIDLEFTFNIAPRIVSSIKQEEEYADINIFPNPSSDKISISGLPSTNSPIKINVFNTEGKLMLSENRIYNSRETTTLDISDLPTGLFILKVQNGNIVTTQKISKI